MTLFFFKFEGKIFIELQSGQLLSWAPAHSNSTHWFVNKNFPKIEKKYIAKSNVSHASVSFNPVPTRTDICRMMRNVLVT